VGPWWGARAIYRGIGGSYFELVWDRQDSSGESGENGDLYELEFWLDTKGFPALRKLLREECPASDEDREVRFSSEGYVIVANPRKSFGYLYIGCWRES